MTIQELLWQEIENTPTDSLEYLLNFLRSIKTNQQNYLPTYQELLERIDYLEAIIGINKGLEELDRRAGIPAEQALATLQQKLSIPPRP